MSSAPRRQVARSVQSFTSSQADNPQPKPTPKPPSLARRLLFPTLPPSSPLPPLLTSPSATPEINEELYTLIALVLRAYVHPWWTKITRYDKEFLPDITRVLARVISTLESRVVHTDFAPLFFRDVPNLLTQHVLDYRTARSKLHTSYAAGGAATLAQMFHNMQPHMAISAEGVVDDAYVRQALDDVLRVCLPEEDYEAEPERFIVREILVKVVLGGVFPRVVQPWFVHQQVLGLLGAERGMEKSESLGPTTSQPHHPGSSPNPSTSTSTFSFQALLIFFLSAIRSISGFCLACMHAYRHTVDTIKKVNQAGARTYPAPAPIPAHKDKGEEKEKSTIPGSLSFGFTTTQPLASPDPPLLSPPPTPPLPPSLPAATTPPPNYISPLLTLLLTLLSCPSPSPSSPHNTPPRALPPALSHTLSLLLTPLSPLLSPLLPHLLHTHLLSPPPLTHLLSSARNALFPGGWPSTPPADPSVDEQVVLRAALARRLRGMIPRPLQIVLGVGGDERVDEMLLEPFASPECNAHLLLFLMDLVLLALFPEMGVSSPSAEEGAGGGGAGGAGVQTPRGSFESLATDLTPPRPDSRPP
ncbi:hypothetical protein BDW22DRAFT_1419010 [Trametopsis cervina]|nr:hypothetical protein BDW22DRAFT_1419010 [Trametopsis cervina]